jgi:hypothetical protein
MKQRLAIFTAMALAGIVNLVSAVPPPKPVPEIPVKACSVERPHKPHDWKGPGGKLFHCPGVLPK